MAREAAEEPASQLASKQAEQLATAIRLVRGPASQLASQLASQQAEQLATTTRRNAPWQQ